jgi:hypothetical protein
MAGSTSNFAHVHLAVLRPVRLDCDAIMIAVTALGLTAAFLFALSAFLQQRAARAAIGEDISTLRDASGVVRLLGHLVRNRTWLVGWITNLFGVGTQAAALKVGSVAAVQPLMASQLLFVCRWRRASSVVGRQLVTGCRRSRSAPDWCSC